MRTSLLSYVLLAALALTGCHKAEPPMPQNSMAEASKGLGVGGSGSIDRTLALAETKGTAAVDTALAAMRAAAVKNPRKTDLWIALGRAWIRKARESSDTGYYAHADACARIALELEPSNRLAQDLHAMVLLNDHKFEEARQASVAITALRDDDPVAYGTLSDALLELGRFDDAARAVQTMVDLKPNLPSYSRASYVRWLQGDTRAAKDIARHAMDAGGDSRDTEPLAWVLVQAGMIFWHEGDYEGADAGFDRALAAFAEFPPALVGKGRVAMAHGDAKRAAELFGRAYAVSPLAETAWLLGDARTAAGDTDGAKDAYGRVLDVGRKTDGRTLALFLATKDTDPARALHLAEAELRVRGDLYTDDTLAWALYRNGRFHEAEKAITRATGLGTRDARLLYHEGAIRIAVGATARGEKLVRRALELNPHFDATGAAEAAALVGGNSASARSKVKS
jgi:tetratricopeptide (TPR) repeat protein